ncbi:MAG TPA: sialidase family protein [Fimbriimonadaceae bacterium]
MIPAFLFALPIAVAGPIVKSEFIYEEAPFPACHASTLAETKGGLVAAWFGGTAESNPDVKIYAASCISGVWTKPEVAGDGIEGGVPYACYNPVLFQEPANGPLLLFYKFGRGPQTWKGRMTQSSDGGKTWAPAWNLPSGVLGPIKDKPILVARHTLLCGSSTEDKGWRVRFERTDDWGKTWTVSSYVNDGVTIGAIQPTILPMGGKRLRALGRTRQQKVFAIDSADNGLTWGPMRLLDVPNPNSGIDAVRLRDGRYLMAYNATTSGRSPLNIGISSDAEHWRSVLVLEDQPGEFSYPAVIQTTDGMVHVTYTWNRRRIRHVTIDPSLLR